MYCPDRSKLRRAARSRFHRRHLVRVVQRERCQLNPTERGRLLRIYPVLRELPAPLLKKVEETAKPVQAPAGLRLFGDGSPCANYPLLLEGTVRASKSQPRGPRDPPVPSQPWRKLRHHGRDAARRGRPFLRSEQPRRRSRSSPSHEACSWRSSWSPRPSESSCSTPFPRGWRT